MIEKMENASRQLFAFLQEKGEIVFRWLLAFLKKNKDIISRIIFLFLIVCEIILCIYQYRTKPVYSNTTEPDDIGIYNAVLAVEYTNYAWGDQDYGFVVNKEGQVKTFDFSDRRVEEEDLLSEFDKILGDSSIPFCEKKISISADVLRKLVNAEDYKLRRPFSSRLFARDAGTYTYSSVSGSGRNRGMLIMRVEILGDIVWKCNDRKINNFCDELGDSFH